MEWIQAIIFIWARRMEWQIKNGFLINALELKLCHIFVQGSHVFAMFYAHALHDGHGHTHTYKRDDHYPICSNCSMGVCLHCMALLCIVATLRGVFLTNFSA